MKPRKPNIILKTARTIRVVTPTSRIGSAG